MGRTGRSTKASQRLATNGRERAPEVARSLVTARQGINTSVSFKLLMSNMMSDVLEGRLSPQCCNAVCNAGGKLLRLVELEHKIMPPLDKNGQRKKLELTA